MSLSASRSVFRQLKWAGRTARRFESTAPDSKSKALGGLSRVTSTAGPAIAGAAKGLGNALGRIGGPTGKLITFIERQIPLGVYYSRVGLELAKLVFHGQKMAPPPLSSFQSYFQPILKALRNPGSFFARTSKEFDESNISNILNRARNMNAMRLVAGGVILVEVLGFFTVGEMVGRRKIVGYRGDKGVHH